MKDVYKLKIVESLLKKSYLHICYDGEEVNYGMGELVVRVLNNHYEVYTIDRACKFDVKEFNDTNEVVNYIIKELCVSDVERKQIKYIMNILPQTDEKKENKTLMTDLYELTMSDIYYHDGRKDEISYFDVFHRSNVVGSGYQVTAGLEEAIDYIKNFHFEEEDIEYLKSTGKLTDEFIEYLRTLRFTGDVWAVPDGTIVFPNEPVMTIKAPIIEAQILETALLTCFNTGSLTATASKRITESTKKRAVAEFGARRVRGGIDATLLESKAAYIGGCSATSNVLAGKKYKIPVTGTIAHALVQSYPTEYEAFLAYAKHAPNKNELVLLVDTYDVEGGILNAIRLQKEYLEPLGYKLKGIRIDSGDLVYLTKMTRKMFHEAGMDYVNICVSNGLDEKQIENLLKQGAEIDNFGIGDNIVAAKDRANFVYKLVAVEKNNEIIPCIKVSADTIKTLNPGYKKTYRFYDKETGKVLGDVISLYHEEIDKEHYTLVDDKNTWKKTELENYTVRELQVPIFEQGKLIYQIPDLKLTREYCNQEYATLTDRITDFENPHKYYVDLSEELRTLKEAMLEEEVTRTKEMKKAYQKSLGEYHA